MVSYLLYFFIYAFLGWCTEVVFAAANHGKFVNRGFLNGPVCPIYGFGVVAVVLALTPLKENLLILYVGSVIVTSLLELVTGFLMEKIFHQRWWDYSKDPMNLGGYICLKFSLLWGAACVLVVDVIHPLIADVVSVLPMTLRIICVCVFGAMILADTAVTTVSVTKMNKRLKQLDEVGKLLHELSDNIGSTMATAAIAAEKKKTEITEEADKKKAEISEAAAKKTAEIKADAEKRREEILAELEKKHARLVKAFPQLHSVKNGDALEQLKQRIRDKKKKNTDEKDA